MYNYIDWFHKTHLPKTRPISTQTFQGETFELTIRERLKSALYLRLKKNRRGDPLKTKKFREKVAQCRKKQKGGPVTLIRFCKLRSVNALHSSHSLHDGWKRFAIFFGHLLIQWRKNPVNLSL